MDYDDPYTTPQFVVGSRVIFCLGTPDIVKARYGLIGKGAYGQGTVREEDNGVYYLDDLAVYRGEEDLIARRTDPVGIDDAVWFHEDELTLAPLPINQETTFGEVRVMLNKAMRHLFDEGDWGPTYDWVKIPHAKGFWDHMTLEELRFIAVYQCEGGSEGHYIHVDMLQGISETGIKGTPCFLLKTFGGLEHAQRIQSMAQVLLGV
jgi:hypothetical protein